jgi:hypothetical protein
LLLILCVNFALFSTWIYIGRQTNHHVWLVTLYGGLFLLSFINIFHYAHVLDQSVWYYEYRSWHMADYVPSLAGFLVGAVSRIQRRVVNLVLVSLCAFVGCMNMYGPMVKVLINPLDQTVLVDTWQDGICLQSTPSTCGPAALATLMKQRGYTVSETTIAQAAYTSGTGTELWYLARFARSQGVATHFVFAPDTIFPHAIIGTSNGYSGHFIAILAIHADEITIADSLRGRLLITREALSKAFHFSGLSLVLTAPDQPPAP